MSSVFVLSPFLRPLSLGRPLAVGACSRFSTLQWIRSLREQTGAPMHLCKEALEAVQKQSSSPSPHTDSTHFLSACVSYLRSRGISGKKSGKSGSEGCVGIQVCDGGKSVCMVEINVQTDFCAKNEKFHHFTRETLKGWQRTRPPLDAPLQDWMQSVPDLHSLWVQTVNTLGENISVRRGVHHGVVNGVCGIYNHHSLPSADGSRLGSHGAVVAIESSEPLSSICDEEKLLNFANQLAMHIVASQPRYLDQSSIPSEELSRERSMLVGATEALNEKKTAQQMDRIVSGKLQKFFEENVLMDQKSCVHTPPVKVADLLVRMGKELKCTLSITGFTRFKVGEGLQANKDNFAQEVAEKLKS